jgi:hypothetical protein
MFVKLAGDIRYKWTVHGIMSLLLLLLVAVTELCNSRCSLALFSCPSLVHFDWSVQVGVHEQPNASPLSFP